MARDLYTDTIGAITGGGVAAEAAGIAGGRGVGSAARALGVGARLSGALGGYVNPEEAAKDIKEQSKAGAFVPFQGSHRLGAREGMLPGKAGTSKNLLATYAGPISTTAGLLGAGAAGSVLTGSDALLHASLAGAGLAPAVAMVAALITKRRTIEEQLEAEKSNKNVAAQMLIPGKAIYEQFKRLGATRNLDPGLKAKQSKDKEASRQTNIEFARMLRPGLATGKPQLIRFETNGRPDEAMEEFFSRGFENTNGIRYAQKEASEQVPDIHRLIRRMHERRSTR